MKTLLKIATALLCTLGLPFLYAQEAATKWSVDIPAPALPEVTPVTSPKADPIQFEVLSSRSKNLYVREAPEMHDLPPIEGRIKMTIQRVANPGLIDPAPPAPAIAPSDPAVIARLQELRETCRPGGFAFISATVYLEEKGAEHARTLLRIYPNGQFEPTRQPIALGVPTYFLFRSS